MKKVFKAMLLFAGSACVWSCSKDDPVEDLEGIYVPLFSNFWPIEKGPLGDAIVLDAVVNSIDSSKGTGQLTGQHQHNTTIYNMKGSFRNLNVELWYLTNAENGSDNGPLQGRKYKGRYDTLANPVRIRMANMSNSTDSLVIRLG